MAKTQTTNRKDATYTCKFNAEQMRAMQQALELYARINMGQLKSVAEHIHLPRFRSHHVDDIKINHYVADKLEELEQITTGLEKNAYYGIAHPQVHESAKIAWDIQQTLRHAQSWTEHPEGGIFVYFDSPLKTAKTNLPEVSVDPEEFFDPKR